MKRILFTVASLAVLCALATADMKWERDYNKATKTAKASKRLIFVDFYADW